MSLRAAHSRPEHWIGMGNCHPADRGPQPSREVGRDDLPAGLRGTLVCGHAALTVLAALMLAFWPPEGSANELFLGLILLYSAVIAVLLQRIQGLSQLFSVFGIATSFTYVAYFVKVVIYLVNPDFFFPDFISSGSPLGQATANEWCAAFGFFLLGTMGMTLGAYLGRNWRLPASGVKDDAQGSLRQRRMLIPFLALGMATVVARWFATAILGLGALYSENDVVLGFAGVAGAIQLSTLWGGRLILATACGAALVAGRWTAICIALTELLLFGCLSTLYTGSKSEILIPLLIVGIVTVHLRPRIDRQMYRFLMLAAAAGLLLIVAIYPAFHTYRYIRQEVTIQSYFSEYGAQMEVGQGLQQVTRRLTGMEGLVIATTYRALGYPSPSPSLKYGDFFTYDMWGIPTNMGIGLEIGFYGGTLAIGGPLCLLAASIVFGFACSLIGRLAERFSARVEAREALHGTLAVWMLAFLLFSGDLLAGVKELFCIGLGATVVRLAAGKPIAADGLGVHGCLSECP
ncbi:MAG: hypothetical protein KJZ87_00825 [Thermoguttaceae bacterium]|nr:hypothetical protein [Thermoguttaceae bacterium]